MYSTWLDRLKVEADDLNRRLSDLRKFCDSEGWGFLEEHDKVLLNRQEEAMQRLLLILWERIQNATAD